MKNIFILIVLVLVSLGAFHFGKQFPQLFPFLASSSEELIPIFDEKHFEQNILPLLSERKFSKEEYVAYKHELETLVAEKDAGEALRRLRDGVAQGKVGKDCHNLSHEVGHAAFKKYQNVVNALEYKQLGGCSFGYIHGVIESYVAATPNPLETMETACNVYTVESEKLVCYHALGHAYMIYFGNDVPLTLQACDLYPERISQIFCAQGAFMENFSSNGDHRSDYVKKEDPLYPCAEQKDIYKSQCYKMAPQYYLTVNNNNFKDILKWCETAPAPYNDSCVRGVSQQLLQYSLKMDVFEQFCLSGTKEQIRPCIEEMVRSKRLYHPEEVGPICRKGLKYEYTKEICAQSAEALLRDDIK